MKIGPADIRMEFKPQDFWVGVYWKAGGPVRHYVPGSGEYRVDRQIGVWICVMPMIPIHLRWTWPCVERSIA